MYWTRSAGPGCASGVGGKPRHVPELPGALAEEDAEVVVLSVLDLLSDDAAGLDSALPPSFAEDDSFDVVSLPVDSLVAFFRASDG